MPKLRRFAVPSLEGLSAGSELLLPTNEAKHVRVLRIQTDTAIELTDAVGRNATATIATDDERGVLVRVTELRAASADSTAIRLVLATAWPKGKRASFLVEKCAELGVAEIVPIAFARTVVSKDEESEGVARLKRIAAEASKQSGRDGAMFIAPELSLADFLTQRDPAGITLLLDPRAETNLADVLPPKRGESNELALIVGPEGGFTQDELALTDKHAIVRVRLARHVLRIETAALAASVICMAPRTR